MNTISLPDDFQGKYETAGTVDGRDRVVDAYFGCETVDSVAGIDAEALYYVLDRQRRLVRIAAADGEAGDGYVLTFVLAGQKTYPLPGKKLSELIRDGRLLKLIPKDEGKVEAAIEDESSAAGEGLPVDPKKFHPECTIDMGTLTQLLSAARQSGLIPNADQIAHVRDCEFRMGKYARAQDVIERMYVKFTQAALQRKQKLQADDVKHKSGALKMSPKEWLKKQQKDNAQTLVIERARKKFAQVLEGLRFLARVEQSQNRPNSTGF